ncbi:MULTISPECIES: hypothetical protein [unclassified Arcicella]|uniref:hypothetical protein n=1 Tax=unclassified Arcicella TaxID=2644986 RepID=UPI00285888B2|nr:MULTISPECIES: hypothetical protein [unclassified Arcicella]MDR6564725.1 hypothetical protein [Arcicella sp. BE51]MDR6814521.1 hypothetical protein [Arcicella sp. BE140]MDR6825891.1 hypothetical protein [Arcicella sp. BE139]
MLGNRKKSLFFTIYCPFLNVDGMAIFPFVLIRTKLPSKILINHERIHLAQQLELLILPFYIWYLSEYLLNRLKGQNHQVAYRNICFEKEAYENEDKLAYLTNRRAWSFLKYLKMV